MLLPFLAPILCILVSSERGVNYWASGFVNLSNVHGLGDRVKRGTTSGQILGSVLVMRLPSLECSLVTF
jgi:hypothetical protein